MGLNFDKAMIPLPSDPQMLNPATSIYPYCSLFQSRTELERPYKTWVRALAPLRSKVSKFTPETQDCMEENRTRTCLQLVRPMISALNCSQQIFLNRG